MAIGNMNQGKQISTGGKAPKLSKIKPPKSGRKKGG
jgi:hypothetical protein